MKCEICGNFEAECVVGIDKDLAYRDEDLWLQFDRDQVSRSCAQCADSLVTKGDAREMPIEVGDATEIWYSTRFELTDGEASVVADWVPDMMSMI